MKTYVYWAVILIGMYLVVKNADKFNNVLDTGSTKLLQGVALLQGRDKVKGVTV